MATAYTDLEIDGIIIPDYASRGMSLTLTPIAQSRQAARDVNGNLVDLSLPRFQQRRVTISCSELEKPIFDDIWPGKIVEVTLIPGLGIGSDESTGSLIMNMMVMGWETSHEEWEARGTWSLELEEIGSDV